jgi:hypothetical protein
MWNGKDTIQRGKGKKMHVEWKGYNSARERDENACEAGKDTIQQGKGKKMHVEWKGYYSARER